MADNEKPFPAQDPESSQDEAVKTAEGTQDNEVSEGVQGELSVDQLAAALQAKDSALEEAVRKYQRLQADFENFRRRTTKEKEELSTLVAEGIITELLPVVDNFERALASDGSKDAEAFHSGVEMIFRQMTGAFEKLGLSAIAAMDQMFDPNEHQAVMRVEDAEKEDGTIVQELQKGYRLKNRVIRPSMVKVVNNG
ncbi:MAG: nucleotide exchange factor GrpE [Sporomusaceae bacterium]|nr:nucleotide exchange factor GrpE [Sporomusaceae bacterium]